MPRTASLPALSLLLLAACGSDGTTATATGTDSMTMTMTMACGTPGETWSAGMSHEGDLGALTFVLVSAEPAPPDVGDNVWTVSLLDASDGTARTDLDLVLSPFMPEHGHGGEDAAFTPLDDTSYVSEPFDLFMAGLWELTLTASSGDTVVDTTTWTFCLEG